MTRIELAPEIHDDFDRIFEHLRQHQVPDPDQRIAAIIKALEVLEENPLIGRPVGGDLRELVIGQRSRGYVARYQYVAAMETVFVLALRGQKEAGYRD
ncbi:MAG TPA: type II toxin-antitoxin system RelE/ParE family toxin [Burkholderiales bacterium]|nr:type II toxin-antitoxin system RelE/ParE family toxin [Burkholderiales bacterium]